MGPLPSHVETSGKLKGMAKYLYCSNSSAPTAPRSDKEQIVDDVKLFDPNVVPNSLAPVKMEKVDYEKGSTSPGSDGSSSSDDLTVLNLVEGKKSLEAAKKRKWSYELNRHFQDNWAQKLPWAEAVIGADGSMSQVKCTICLAMFGQTKLLSVKLDNMWKHAGRCRVEKDIYVGNKLKVKFGDIFFSKDCAHVRNELVQSAKNQRDGHLDLQQLHAQATTAQKNKKAT